MIFVTVDAYESRPPQTVAPASEGDGPPELTNYETPSGSGERANKQHRGRKARNDRTRCDS
jgi:hypothetical protein